MSKYIIEGKTMTNIADAIREKAGIDSALYPETMPSYIRGIQTSDTADIPDYVVTEGKRVARGMIAKRGGNSITAVILSDMHELGDNDAGVSTIDITRRGNLNAGQGAKVIADNIDLDFVAHLGDLCFGAKTSTITDFVQGIVNAKGYMHDVAKNHETFFTPGNHDTATYGFAQNGEYLSQGVLDALIGTYRYVDFAAKKVRVICLNTAEVEGMTVSGSSGTERITGKQLQWFAEALDLSAKSDAADWGIIILSHHPLDWGNILPAANCLQAYLTGGSYAVTHNGVAVSKNFSGKNAAKVICQFHGHVHGFKVDNIRYGTTGNLKSMDVKRIAIPNAYFYRNNEYGDNGSLDSNGLEFGEDTTYPKTDGTAKNTAFCLVSIDLDKKVIYADCYGAGYDRVIRYAVGYFNLVPTAIADSFGSIYNAPYGYMNGKYVSSSGINQFSNDAACVATGSILLPTTANAIYIKGAAWDTSNGHARFASGGEVGGVSYVCHADGSGTEQLSRFFTVKTLDDNYYKWTLTDDGRTYLRGRYYRLSLVGTGENLIITHDEPIVEEAPVIYSVTNILTNVTNSSTSTDANSGSYYYAILTAKSGYTLTGGTVKVTMGGTDITSTAYSGGTISISKVTGDIVITASAVLEQTGPAYTNRVLTSIDTDRTIYKGTGYQEGYRLNSSGATSELAGAVNSGFIPYNGEVIRAYGTANGTIGNSGNYIVLYDSNFNKTLVQAFNTLRDYGATWAAQDGKYMITVDLAALNNSVSKAAFESAAYIRCGFASCTGADFVVTLDEPIQ